MAEQWPWLGDTQSDKARRVALSYREALRQVDPELCDQLDAQFVRRGQAWVAPRLDLDLQGSLPVADAADLIGVTVYAVYKWIRDGELESHTNDGGRIAVSVAAVLEVARARRQRRASRAPRRDDLT